MKKSRKLMSVLLIVAMLFTLAAPAMATPTATTISVDDERTYEVYQIFTGDLHEGKLSNITWGENGTGTKGAEVDEEILKNLTAINTPTATDLEKLAVIDDYVKLTSAPVETVSKNNPATVVTGYYLLKDVTEVDYGEELSLFVVKIVDNTTIEPKAKTVTSYKKVKDTDDTAGTTTDWQDSADYDIGDTINFQLTGTVTEKYDQYTKYEYIFHDEESPGLTFDKGSVKVYVDGTQITSGFTIVEKPSCKHENCTFEIRFDNLKDIDAVHAESVITVEYKSTLNESANIGSKGNPNIMYLEYSNNPNSNGTGTTEKDKVTVFTYQVVVNKVDENNKALNGASFELFKNVGGEWESKGVVGDKTTTSSFTWTGLDDGEYKLEETKTPAGYNSIDPIKFTITADHEIKSADPALKSLSGGKLFTGEVSTGTLSANVENKSGATLPETGGMGTTIFYVVGGALVLGAAVLLVTRRRMAE